MSANTAVLLLWRGRNAVRQWPIRSMRVSHRLPRHLPPLMMYTFASIFFVQAASAAFMSGKIASCAWHLFCFVSASGSLLCVRTEDDVPWVLRKTYGTSSSVRKPYSLLLASKRPLRSLRYDAFSRPLPGSRVVSEEPKSFCTTFSVTLRMKHTGK